MAAIYAFMIGFGSGYVALQVARNFFGVEADLLGFVMGSLAIGLIAGGIVGMISM